MESPELGKTPVLPAAGMCRIVDLRKRHHPEPIDPLLPSLPPLAVLHIYRDRDGHTSWARVVGVKGEM